jgi:hypothetical protein
MKDLAKGFEAIVPLFEMCKGSEELEAVIIDIQNAIRNGR